MFKTKIAAFVSLEQRIESLQAELNALELEMQDFLEACPSNTREKLHRHEVLPDLEAHIVMEIDDLRGKNDPRSAYLRSLLVVLAATVAGVSSLLEKYIHEKRKK